jgi:hypothetical protein
MQAEKQLTRCMQTSDDVRSCPDRFGRVSRRVFFGFQCVWPQLDR